MKNLPSLFAPLRVAAATALLTGCTPQFAYQVFETHPEAYRTSNQPALDFTYDFWNFDGQVGAVLTNTSAGPVYLDLNRSHLIVNGASFDYYTDVEYETSQSIERAAAGRPLYSPLYGYGSGAVGASAAAGSATRVRTRPVVEIPPGAHFNVRPMSVVGGPVASCELNRYDSRTNAVVGYDSATTPLRFRFYLTYSRQPDLSQPEVLDAGFRVVKITAMMSRAFLGPTVADTDPCTGKRRMTSSSTYPFAKPENLYLGFTLTP